MNDKTTKKKFDFIREHTDKAVVDRIQIELYLFIYKLLREEIDKHDPNPQDRNAS